jgi:large subunit ribosomal protein L25
MEATLEAVTRDTRGKNHARRLRVAGQIPAIVYGGQDAEPLAVAVSPKTLSKILHSQSGVNTIISLEVDGTTTQVLVKDYLLEPVTHTLLHADFYRLDMSQRVTVKVPVVLHGEPRGIKQQGGVLDFVHREVELESLPGDIPEHIDIDVKEMMIGDGVYVRDVAEGKAWTAISPADLLLVHIVAPRVEAAGTEEAAPEPEVTKKGKAEDK